MNRHPIQIAVVGGPAADNIYALADDHTLWRTTSREDAIWRRLPDLPQDQRAATTDACPDCAVDSPAVPEPEVAHQHLVEPEPESPAVAEVEEEPVEQVEETAEPDPETLPAWAVEGARVRHTAADTLGTTTSGPIQSTQYPPEIWVLFDGDRASRITPIFMLEPVEDAPDGPEQAPAEAPLSPVSADTEVRALTHATLQLGSWIDAVCRRVVTPGGLENMCRVFCYENLALVDDSDRLGAAIEELLALLPADLPDTHPGRRVLAAMAQRLAELVPPAGGSPEPEPAIEEPPEPEAAEVEATEIKSDCVGWLVHCSATDTNWEGARDKATAQELRDAIAVLKDQGGPSKTKIKKLEARLKKLERQAAKAKPQPDPEPDGDYPDWCRPGTRVMVSASYLSPERLQGLQGQTGTIADGHTIIPESVPVTLDQKPSAITSIPASHLIPETLPTPDPFASIPDWLHIGVRVVILSAGIEGDTPNDRHLRDLHGRIGTVRAYAPVIAEASVELPGLVGHKILPIKLLAKAPPPGPEGHPYRIEGEPSPSSTPAPRQDEDYAALSLADPAAVLARLGQVKDSGLQRRIVEVLAQHPDIVTALAAIGQGQPAQLRVVRS